MVLKNNRIFEISEVIEIFQWLFVLNSPFYRYNNKKRNWTGFVIFE